MIDYSNKSNKELLDIFKECQEVLLQRRQQLISDKNTFMYIISTCFQNNVLLLQHISESNFRLYNGVNDGVVVLALKEMKKHKITFYND